MKTILKIFYYHASQILDTIISLLTVLLFSKINSHRKLSKICKSIPNNHCCFILGNGPSLSSEMKDYNEAIINSEVFVVNSFGITKEFDYIKPKHYCYIDPDLWRDGYSIEKNKERDELFKALIQKTKWNMYFYIPWEAFKNKKLRKIFSNNEFVQLIPINITPFKAYTFIQNIVYSYNLGMPRPQNVLIASIFIAINLGFKEINLLGCDHSWTENICVNEYNQLCIKDIHFYDSKIVTQKPWIKDDKNNVFKIHEILNFFSHTFLSHQKIREYADTRQTKIFNRTKNSFIDAYERKS